MDGEPVENEHTEEPRLDDAERTLVTGIASGMALKEIGKRHHVSTDTVKSRLARLFRRFGVRNQEHLVATCYRRGLLDGYPLTVHEREQFAAGPLWVLPMIQDHDKAS